MSNKIEAALAALGVNGGIRTASSHRITPDELHAAAVDWWRTVYKEGKTPLSMTSLSRYAHCCARSISFKNALTELKKTGRILDDDGVLIPVVKK